MEVYLYAFFNLKARRDFTLRKETWYFLNPGLVWRKIQAIACKYIFPFGKHSKYLGHGTRKVALLLCRRMEFVSHKR